MTESGEADVTAALPTVDLALTIAESKVVFSSHVLSFAIKGGTTLNVPCRDRAFHLSSKPSLYSGWSPEDAAKFSETVDGARFQEHTFASCRDAETEVLAWFGKERDLEFTVSEQLLDDDYNATKLPVLLRLKKIGADAATYYSCSGAFSKKLVGETENAKKFEIALSCKARNAPTKGERGPVEFISNPGKYASVASYREWMLPAVPSNKENLERVRKALFAKVAEGTYSGAMATLSKKCNLKIEKTADGLIVDHTIVSSDRTRHLELKAADLLGYAEGDLYADLNGVEGAPVGKFAAAEFRDSKGESLTVRFEKNDGLDAQVVRINGSEAYCRRLVKN